MEMTLEQQRAIALVRARRRRRQEAPPDVSLAENVGRAAVKGLSGVAAFPAEVAGLGANFGAFLAGTPEPEKGTLGSYILDADPTALLQAGLERIGLRSDPQPDGVGERFATNTAEALVGGLGAIGAASRATGVVRAGTERLMAGRLGRFAAEDAAAATAGAAARTTAEELGMDEFTATVPEFAASFLTSGAIYRARALTGAARSIGGVVEKAGQAFKSSEKRKAAELVQGNIRAAGEDPKEVAQGIRTDLPGPLSTGARSDSPALRALENTLITKNPELRAQYMGAKQDLKDFVQANIRAAIGDDGIPDDAIAAYRMTPDYAIGLAEKNYQAAMREGKAQLDEMPPLDIEYGSPLRQRMEEAKRLDHEMEKDFWSQIGPAELDSSGISNAYQSLLDEQARAGAVTIAGPSAINMAAVKTITERGSTTVDEMLALRTNLLEEAAEATANGQKSLARRLNMLADGALETLQSAKGENSEAINQARAYSKAFNDRWSRDVIGELMAETARRGQSVADNQTMEKLFRRGEQGRTNMQALRLALRDIPPEAKSYILQQFFKKAVVGEVDGINVPSAEGFMQDYRPLLEETGLFDTIGKYVVTGRNIVKAKEERDILGSAFSKTAAAQVLKKGNTGDDLTAYIGGLFVKESKNAQDELTQLFEQSLADPTGAAFAGVKAAAAEALVSKIYTYTGETSLKIPTYMTRALNALEATGEFSEEQLGRIRLMGEIAHRQVMSGAQKAFPSKSTTAEETAAAGALPALLKVGALKYVAPLVNAKGPGSLSIASTIGKLAEQWGVDLTQDSAGDLIRRAVFDPDLMQELLRDPSTLTERGKGLIRAAVEASKKLPGIATRTVTGGFTPSQTTMIQDLTGEDDGR